MIVKLYRNLKYRVDRRYPAWSLATGAGRGAFKVFDTVDGAVLTDVELVVMRTARQYVLKTGKKKVHAFAVGKLGKTWPLDSLKSGTTRRDGKPFVYSDAGPADLVMGGSKLKRVGYDPFQGEEFVRVDCGVVPIEGEIEGAAWVSKLISTVVATPQGVYAKLGACPRGLRGFEGVYTRFDEWNG